MTEAHCGFCGREWSACMADACPERKLLEDLDATIRGMRERHAGELAAAREQGYQEGYDAGRRDGSAEGAPELA